MRRLLVLSGLAMALVLAAFAGVGGQEQSEAAVVITFEVGLSGELEIPAVHGPAKGFTRFTFDEATKVLTYDLTVSGVSPSLVTAAHIHRGGPTENGPAFHTISATGFAQASGQVTLTDADVTTLKAGGFYVNIHTTDNPGGAARGQLFLNPVDAVGLALEKVAVGNWNAADLEGFLAAWTESGFQDEFGATKEEGAEFLPEELGDPPVSLLDVRDIVVSGRTASATWDIAFGGTIERNVSTFVLDGHWKIDSSAPGTVPIPSGTTAVDINLREFAFVYDPASITSGNIAFSYENVGAQAHEIALLKLDTDVPLEELIVSEEDVEGVEFIGVAAPIEPGTSGNLVFTEPLSAGRYGLVCFFPDTSSEEQTPHAFLGMISEFTVRAGITPPSTGDAGLAAGSHSPLGLLLGIATLFAVVTGAGALRVARRRA